MATIYWLGTADAVAQVVTVQVTAFDAATTYELKAGGVIIASASGNADANATATALANAWNASTHPYATGVTASSSTDTVTLTADVAGVPFVVTSSATGGTGAIGAPVTTTANAGPNDWSTAENWSGGAVPVTGDDVVFDSGGVNVCWGLDQSAVTLASLVVRKTYTGKIGLDARRFATSADGETFASVTKPEYRDHYLKIGYDSADIGAHEGPGQPSGSQRIKVNNVKAGTSTTSVRGTALAASESALPAVRLLFANGGAELFVRSAPGGVGVAADLPGETSQLGKCVVTDSGTTTRVVLGDGVTLGSWEQLGGDNVMRAAAAVSAVTVSGGTLTVEGGMALTALTVRGGRCIANNAPASGDAITTLTLEGGEVDASRSGRSRTLGTVNLNGGQIKADGSALTITTLNEPTGLYTLSAS